MTSSEAGTLRGQLGWARSFQFGRFGAAALRPLAVRQHNKQHLRLNPALRASMLFWVRVLKIAGGKPIPYSPERMDLHIIVTDGEGTGWVAAGWWRPRQSDWAPRVTRARVPPEWREAWKQGSKDIDINEIEAVGPMLAMNTWPELRGGM
eukprot:6014017-Pyramimonas_sp.AAC.1